MKLTSILIFTAPLIAVALSLRAQDQQQSPPTAGLAPAGVFEAPPTLSAVAILRPEYYQGPNFQVLDPVPTYAGSNAFTIDSDFGVFEANGNQMLMRRVREIAAIAKLREISGTQEFAQAARKAAETPLVVAQNLISNPVGTISGVPQGIWKFLNQAGQSVKEIGEGRQSDPGHTAENLIGFSKTKRDIALKLGVDPYSTNEVFQRELNKIAWPAFVGGFAVRLGMGAVTGGAGLALSAANWTSTLIEELRDKSPVDLRLMNLGKLLNMGIAREDAVSFLNNKEISPSVQTILVAALEPLDGTLGRDEFIRQAASSDDEHEALFFQQCAQLMTELNATAPLARITQLNGLPVCLTTDGTVVVPIQWDYVSWTPMTERFVTALQAANFGAPVTGYLVALTGVVSPMAGEALTARGIKYLERQLPNPLK